MLSGTSRCGVYSWTHRAGMHSWMLEALVTMRADDGPGAVFSHGLPLPSSQVLPEISHQTHSKAVVKASRKHVQTLLPEQKQFPSPRRRTLPPFLVQNTS